MCVPQISPVGAAAVDLLQGFSDSKVLKENARISMMEGRDAITSAESKANQIRTQGERFQSSTRASQAASGVDLSYGSAVEVGRESATNIEKDALLAGYEGRKIAAVKNYEAMTMKRQAKAAVMNAGLKAGSTILGAAEKVISGGFGGGK
jgi:hypothetical protein